MSRSTLMKVFVRGLGFVLAVGALVGLGLAWARPDWRPSRARFDPGQIWSWLHWEAGDDDDGRARRTQGEGRPDEMIDDGWCAARAKWGAVSAVAGDCSRFLPV